MKVSRISVIVAAAFIFFGCVGCQDDQLSQCQQENADLQAKIEAQEIKLKKNEKSQEGAVQVMIDLMMKMDKLSKENKALKAQKPEAEITVDPEEAKKKEDIQKGLQELFKLRQEAAEKMKQ